MELLDNKVVQTVVKHLNIERVLLEESVAKREGVVEVLSSIAQVAVVASKQSKENDKLDAVIEQKRKTLGGIETQIEVAEKDGEDKASAINHEIKTLKTFRSKTKSDMDADEKKYREERANRIATAGIQEDEKITEYKNQEAEAKARKDKDLETTELDQLISKRRVFKDEMAKI